MTCPRSFAFSFSGGCFLLPKGILLSFCVFDTENGAKQDKKYF